MSEICIFGLPGIPEVHAGDDLAGMIVDAARAHGGIDDGDVFVVTQKVVSKAEGRIVDLERVTPSAFARQIAEQWEKDARQVEVVLGETKRIVRMGHGVVICGTHHGFICANAGVDASNVPGYDIVCLLPPDPDASAAQLQAELRRLAPLMWNEVQTPLLLIGLPLIMAEFALGRLGRASPIGTFHHLTRRAHANPLWKLVGWMGVISVFLILSYLSVIAGWVIAFLVRSALGIFAGLTADGMSAQFAQMVKDPERQLFWHTLFMTATMLMVARGVRHGLETVVRYAVPLLLGLMLGLLIYVSTTDAFVYAANLFFTPDFTKLTGMGVLAAMSHAFFSLGLGAGAMLMYGAYLGADAPVPRLSACQRHRRRSPR